MVCKTFSLSSLFLGWRIDVSHAFYSLFLVVSEFAAKLLELLAQRLHPRVLLRVDSVFFIFVVEPHHFTARALCEREGVQGRCVENNPSCQKLFLSSQPRI